MHERCIYCGHALADRDGGGFPRRGVRLAFDPDRLRLWTICDQCHGWNLWWRDERSAMLFELERTARTRARVLFETDHVALLEAAGRQLVRVGRAPRREEAWWRYGRRLRQRRDSFRSPLTQAATAAYSAVSTVGTSVGLSNVTGDFRRATNRPVEILRWRRFGGTAWQGRAACPSCGSVLIRLFFLKCDDLILMPAGDGSPAVGLPCVRCDPWSAAETHQFDVLTAEPLLRRVLAWHNISGATSRELNRAVGLIESAGSARTFVERLSCERLPLHSMTKLERLALEVAVNERAERVRLGRDAADLEAQWFRAEELAAIIDDELE
jgi:hypothetical protein